MRIEFYPRKQTSLEQKCSRLGFIYHFLNDSSYLTQSSPVRH